MIVQLYLENVEFDYSLLHLDLNGDFRVRPLFVDEIMTQSRDFFVDFSPACVIETLALPSAKLHEAEAKVRSVFLAMLLFEDRIIRSRRISSDEAKLRTLSDDDMSKLVYNSWPSWRMVVRPSGMPSHVIPFRLHSEEDAQKFKTFWNKFCQVTQLPIGYFRMALDSFAYATDLIAGNQWQYRLIEYVVSLEALLTENDSGISYKLPMRIVSLLDDPTYDRNFTFEFVRKMYDLRSKLVHGAELKKLRKLIPIKVEKKSFDHYEAIDVLHSLSRDCIRAVFELLCSRSIKSSKESLTEYLDRKLIA